MKKSPKEPSAELLETQEFCLSEIAKAFGIPAESMQNDFARWAIRLHQSVRALEDAADDYLIKTTEAWASDIEIAD